MDVNRVSKRGMQELMGFTGEFADETVFNHYVEKYAIYSISLDQ